MFTRISRLTTFVIGLMFTAGVADAQSNLTARANLPEPRAAGAVVETDNQGGVGAICSSLMQFGDKVSGRAASGRRHGVLLAGVVRERAGERPPVRSGCPYLPRPDRRAGAPRVTRYL